jgi:hypothetical protein
MTVFGTALCAHEYLLLPYELRSGGSGLRGLVPGDDCWSGAGIGATVPAR